MPATIVSADLSSEEILKQVAATSDLCQCVRSEVPETCTDKSESVILGIDEAGRGPVLGPMIYGAAYWRAEDEGEISKLAFDDSKALSEAKREEMLGTILKNSNRIGWVLRVISARELSNQMMRRVPVSLNRISHAAAMEMIRVALDAGVNVTKVFVDTVGDPETYERMLTNAFHDKIEFCVRKKADALFKVVGAASICAKVTRDHIISNWEFKEPGIAPNQILGSGYPGDVHFIFPILPLTLMMFHPSL